MPLSIKARLQCEECPSSVEEWVAPCGEYYALPDDYDGDWDIEPPLGAWQNVGDNGSYRVSTGTEGMLGPKVKQGATTCSADCRKVRETKLRLEREANPPLEITPHGGDIMTWPLSPLSPSDASQQPHPGWHGSTTDKILIHSSPLTADGANIQVQPTPHGPYTTTGVTADVNEDA